MCTSFAAYFEKPIYGMNHDLFDTETKFSIVKCENSINIFLYDVKFNNNFVHNAGMNSKGIFCSFQNDETNNYISMDSHSDFIDADDIFLESLWRRQFVREVEEKFKKAKVRFPLSPPNPKLHNLYADKTGYAIIVEAGKDTSEISPILDKFIVMTNFTNSNFRNKDFCNVSGPGDKRYISAYKYLSQINNTFGLKDAFNILRQTAQASGKTKTQSSMVFMPEENNIYIVLKRRFDKVWKVSLDNNTLQTFSGFESNISIALNSEGICSSELERAYY